MGAHLARSEAGRIFYGSSGAVEEYVALITAKSKPLVEKPIHFPSTVELRHTTPKPVVHFSSSLATAMTDQFRRTDIVVNTDSCVRFEGNSRFIDESIGEQ